MSVLLETENSVSSYSSSAVLPTTLYSASPRLQVGTGTVAQLQFMGQKANFHNGPSLSICGPLYLLKAPGAEALPR